MGRCSWRKYFFEISRVRPITSFISFTTLIVPSLPDLMQAAEVAPRLDALLLTGSPSNLDTRLYGDEVPDAAG